MDKSFIPAEDINLIRNGQVVFKEALLVADISGFTHITELLAKDGKEGTEELTILLNNYFDKMISIISNYSGSIITFSGDSVLARFEKEQNALNCAKEMLDVMDTFSNITILDNIFSLKTKVVIGSGEWNEYIIGNDSHAHILLSGKLIRELAKREDVAEADSLLHFTSTSRASSTPIENIQTSDEAFLSPGSERLTGEHRAVTAAFLNIYTQEFGEEVILNFQKLYLDVTDIVSSFGGHLHHIDNILGEGSKILLLFGAPVSHGDDTLNAVKAMNKVITGLKDKYNFNVSCGIDTGFVFSGNIGNEKRKQYTVIGDSVNTAARLAANTLPGTVNVSESVFNRTNKSFSFTKIPSISVKGKNSDLKRYVPKAETTTSANTLPFIGRKTELQQMLQQINSNSRILLTGNAGIGKSTFLNEIKNILIENKFSVVITGKTKYGSANEIPAALVKSICGITSDMNENVVENILHNHLLGTKNTDIISRELYIKKMLLGIDVTGNTFKTMSPKLRHENLLEAIRLLILELPSPLCLIIEDIHYASIEEQSFVNKIIEPVLRQSQKKICFLISTRPEGSNTILNNEATTNFSLVGMSNTESNELLLSIASGKPVDLEIQQILTQRAEGNPFFLVQFFLYLKEKNLIKLESGAWRKSSETSLKSLPESIFSMIMARIDSLAESTRECLKVASVVGVRFDEKLLQQIIERNVHCELEESSKAGLTYMFTLAELEYLFSHMLIRDVAYDSILREQRRFIHRDIGNILEPAQHKTKNAAILAYHFQNAEDWAKAVKYSMKAGEQAEEQYRNQEVIDYYRNAITILKDKFPEQNEKLAICYTEVANIYDRIVNFKAAKEYYTKAEDASNDFSRKSNAILRIADILFSEGKLDDGLEMVNALSRKMKKDEITNDIIELNIAAYLAWTNCVTGDLKTAMNLALLAVKIGENLTDLPEIVKTKKMGHALNTLATVHWASGEYSKAGDLYERAVQIALENELKREAALTYGNIGLVLEKQGKFREASIKMKQQLKIAEEIGDKILILSANGELCTAYAQTGNITKAIYCGKKQEKLAEVLGVQHDHMLAVNHLAEIYAIVNLPKRALKYAEKALALSREFSFEREEAFALMVMGNIAIRQNRMDDALDFYTKAEMLSIKINAFPVLVDTYLSRLSLLISIGDLSSAIEIFDKTDSIIQKVETLTSKARYDCYKALFKAAEGNIDEAIKLFEKGDAQLVKLEAKPARASLHKAFASLLLKFKHTSADKYKNIASELYADFISQVEESI